MVPEVFVQEERTLEIMVRFRQTPRNKNAYEDVGLGLSRLRSYQSPSSRSASPNLVQANWTENSIATGVAWTRAAYWSPLEVSLVDAPVVVKMSCCDWSARKYLTSQIRIRSLI
jgi:hypothetical protein